MRLLLLALAVLLAQGASLQAQTSFDMSPERSATPEVEQAPSDHGQPANDQTTQPAVTVPASDPAANETFRRYLLPDGKLDLNGERENRVWSVYLTPQQAATAAELHIGYQNSIFVAPETSRLTIEVNDTIVADQAIQSPDAVSQLRFALPKDLLKPGANLVRMRNNQRHRTDCTVESTYQLWSNIDAEKTYISFGDRTAQNLQSLDDIRAIGVNEKGLTGFNFVVPALEQSGATIPLMRLAQGLAVFTDMPNQSFSFSQRDLTKTQPGELTVLIGTPAEIQPLLPSLPAGAASGPVAGFIEDPASRSSILVLSGPTWQAISAAIESIVAPTDVGGPATRREVLATQRWRSPDAPFLFSDTRLRFSQLGIDTEQFSGRRFRTDFTVGVPADFYANAYGEAVILLDAAYSEAVLPGSHIDVYVNGNIASTIPITSSGGGLLRHLPINVTMRHFRPGVNTIAIEAILQTEDDTTCVPGATGSETARFAIFDTSEFHMPDFARIAQLPNLAAAAGTGFPYGRNDTANPLFLDRVDADTLSAAATFLGRLAAASGHPIAVETVASPALIGNRSAVFIGALSQMPQKLLTQMNIAEASRNAWGPDTGEQAGSIDTETALSEWSSRLRGGIWGAQIDALETWLKQNFDISLSTLRFAAAGNTSFTPSSEASLLIAQSPSPDGSGTWSLVAAPSGKDLREGMQALSARDNWQQLAGQITTYERGTNTVETVPINAFSFVPTQPASLSNYRLIAANWLSSNILSYAVLLAALGVLLGLATATLLGNLGRRK
ncbi:cellulose biosynthesis cyclic di-GMP-binding regulatory protein BcsB [Pararhizobium gei]|uniref:cellulose biosynthesis cyclic di-GMP-binding regulatory protein BcsB n=1 Tax=Pararhizobium gei TaxID=1395951 RepID=UPI0023DA81FF|nr:cellulose biosynthesis cyclic di-GMP-binding regulatory protein BcsB [Rhizobium gei]